MSTDAVGGVGSTTGSAASTTSTTLAKQTNDLGQDAFLKLLVTQLQNQDPTKPMDDSQFITQLATFSSLEKLTQIADSTTSMSQLLQSAATATTDTTSAAKTTGATTATAN
jgi:flagellar basal-body rod modification protein FlgD